MKCWIRAVLTALVMFGPFASLLPRALAASPQCPADTPRGLVLSGGGIKGAFEAGAVYHLVIHRGCDFQDLSGVSAGALNAAFLAQAPVAGDSLANLRERAMRLVVLWKTITNENQIMEPRFGGLVMTLLLGRESIYDFTPLREIIQREIKVHDLAVSGRTLRVGAVSFWDGRYQEILSTAEFPGSQDQFLEYVLASASIPLIAAMPRIRETLDQPQDDDTTWSQFGDGGLRHNTPISGFFDVPPIKALSDIPDIPPHPRVAALFAVVASPYSAASDQLPPPKCCPDPNRYVRRPMDIFMRSLDISLNAPYRWDLNYALALNKVLAWREELYAEIVQAKESASAETIDILNNLLAKIRSSRFPITSFNVPADGSPSRPYQLTVIAPERYYGTFDVSKAIVHKQLNEGCLAADKAVVEQFRVPSLSERCAEELPAPTE